VDVSTLRERFPADVSATHSRHAIDVRAVWNSFRTTATDDDAADDDADDRAADPDLADTCFHEARHAIVVAALMGRVVAMRYRPADRPGSEGVVSFRYPPNVTDWQRCVIAAAGSDGDRGQLEAKGLYLEDSEWADAVLEAGQICDRNAYAVTALAQAFMESDLLDEEDVNEILMFRFVR
jgi:hypothetical protein